MRRITKVGPPIAIILLAVGTADARSTRPVSVSEAPRPRLEIVSSERGFVIRLRQSGGAVLPRASVPLGAGVHIDAAALRNSNRKDIDHGETR